MNKRETRARARRAERYGRLAEVLCALALRLKGYRLLARRHRTPMGEIDLIALRGRTVVFVEIKARRSVHEAAEAIRPRQRARILRAAEYFLSRRPELADRPVRFDAMLAGRFTLPRHVKDIWRKGYEGIR